jgi:hypothetical protein
MGRGSREKPCFPALLKPFYSGGYFFSQDIHGGGQLTVKNPRGMLIESSGPTYLVGTAMEHS